MTMIIAPPDQADLLAPILPALPAAAASAQPATQLLPLLSPVLRQRVRAFSDSSTEPWLRLLCWDAGKAARLTEIARGPDLEPHPVSGEVEVDWGYDAETRYKRLDRETLQALVALTELKLAFKLEYCVNDNEGGGDGWRIGEVTVADAPTPFSIFGGTPTIAEAERQFKVLSSSHDSQKVKIGSVEISLGQEHEWKNDDDDDYWARYDVTPARTPVEDRSLATSTREAGAGHLARQSEFRSRSAEDHYFAQYDNVQPAMDNHDPDEEAQAAKHLPLLESIHGGISPWEIAAASDSISDAERMKQVKSVQHGASTADMAIQHPRPDSTTSSSGSNTVAQLEKTAGQQEQNEFGVKQHISRSIRNLYVLSKTSGIDLEEFESLVKTELELLKMMDEGE